jgi:hypothetical protein
VQYFLQSRFEYQTDVVRWTQILPFSCRDIHKLVTTLSAVQLGHRLDPSPSNRGRSGSKLLYRQLRCKKIQLLLAFAAIAPWILAIQQMIEAE